MNFSNKLKSVWFYYPLLLTVLIFVVAKVSFFSFDIIQFKTEYPKIHKAFIFSLISVTPLLFLYFSNYWKKQTLNKKILLFALITYLFDQLFNTNTNYIFTIVFSIAVINYYYHKEETFKFNFYDILLIIYVIINVISLFWSLNFNKGLLLTGNYSPLLLMVLLFKLFKLNKQDYNLIFLVFLRLIILYIFISICCWIIQSRFMQISVLPDSILQKMVGNGIEPYKLTFAWSNYVHPTYIAIIVLFSLILGWYYLNKKDLENGITITGFIFLNSGVFFLFIFSGSRFLGIGWLIVNVLGILYLLKTNKLWIMSAAGLLFAVSVIVYFSFPNTFLKFYNDPVREAHYKAATQSIKENTWHGTGLGGMTEYINAENPLYKSVWFNTDFPHIHPHNQFVGDLMQTGIFGLLVIILITGYLFLASVKQRNWLLFVFMSIILFLMMVEMPLLYVKGVFSFSLISVLLVNMEKEKTEDAYRKV